MSTLLESLRNFESSHKQWRPLGENLNSFHERGVSASEFMEQIDLSGQVNQVTAVAEKLIQLLKGDRDNFQEGWERLLSAAHLSKIDLESKYSAGTISKEEIEELTERVMDIKKYGSTAALGRRDSFSSLGLEAREVFIIEAMNEKSIEIRYVPWVNELPKSPEIEDFKKWQFSN